MICCVLVFYGFLLFLLLRSFCFAATFHQEAFSIIHSTPVPVTDFCTQQRSQNEAEEAMALPETNLLRFFNGALCINFNYSKINGRNSRTQI